MRIACTRITLPNVNGCSKAEDRFWGECGPSLQAENDWKLPIDFVLENLSAKRMQMHYNNT